MTNTTSSEIAAEGMSVPTASMFVAALVILLISLLYLQLLNRAKKTTSSIPLAPVNLIQTIINSSASHAPWFILNLAKECNSWCFRLPIPLPSGVFVVGDHEWCKKILMDDATQKPMIAYQSSEVLTGAANMFSSPSNQYWKFTRKTTVKAFSKSEVNRMKTVCMKHVQDFIEKTLQEHSDQDTTFDPSEEMIKITMRSILETAFEYQLESDQELDSLLDYTASGFIEFRQRLMNPFRKVVRHLIPSSREAERKCKLLQEAAMHILETYRKNPDKSENKTIIRLIAEANFASDQQRVSEIVALLIAGYDTTGYTLATTLVLLAKHPQVQEKLRQELAITGESTPFLDQVLRESFRVLPVGAMLPMRVAGRDLELSSKVTLPKGAICLMPQILANYNPSVFPSPEKFDPDRWANATPAMKESLIPFALGSRACPGQSLARAELNAALPKLITNFRFILVEEGKPVYSTTMKMAGSKLKAQKIVA